MTEESRQVAGRYKLVELVGSGAMGMVWRGEDRILGRVVAVKELLMPLNQGPEKVDEARHRAMREARIAARLQHPNAISVFNVVEYEDRPWLIMEYLPSRSLSAKLHDDGPLTVDEVIPIAVQLAGVLTAAHRAGIVHRDVKPGNILLGEDGTVKVTDFGISRAVGDVTLTATGEISGTPAFLAPEVARGEDATFASDVFALGATLYMAVEGVPPFGTADNAIALLYRVSSGSITPPKQAGKLEPLLQKLLELNPADRPSMAEVAAELSKLDGGVTPVATVPEPPTLPETKPPVVPTSVLVPGTPGAGFGASVLSGDGSVADSGASGEDSAVTGSGAGSGSGSGSGGTAAGSAGAAGGGPGAGGGYGAAGYGAGAAGGLGAGGLGAASGSRAAGFGAAGDSGAAGHSAAGGSGAGGLGTAGSGAGGPGTTDSAAAGPGAAGFATGAAGSSGAAGSGISAGTPGPGTADGTSAATTPAASTAPASPVDRRRRGMIFSGVGALIVVLAVILTVVLTRNQGQPTPAAEIPASAGSPAPSSPPPSPPPTSPPSSAPSTPATPEAMVAALRDYFSYLPGNLDRGWAMLSDGFRARHNQTFNRYQSWWTRFKSVTANDIKVTGDNTLSAQITYQRTDGHSTTERHNYTMLQRNGTWQIDVEN
ncbi:serine/threonine-protein kinase [Amycolatopsis jejuensis]|uniref:serine/threonine-protein kinase n=1 Tax=Amycolatopsis jejuensis TaxID=330084 RepID=UPI00316AE40D